MATPRYVAKKVGNDYELVRVDSTHRAKLSAWTVSGVALAVLGFSRRSIGGAVVGGIGSALAICALAGTDPLCKLNALRRSKVKASGTPSFQHDLTDRNPQEPRDLVDETSMESFPASDAPAHTSTTASPAGNDQSEVAAGR